MSNERAIPAEHLEDIATHGHVRATVGRESLRSSFPILIGVTSALTVAEARTLARNIEQACADHERFLQQ